MLTGKVFEYLFIGKPILAITREGELADMLERSGAGIVVPPNDTERVASALLDIYEATRCGRLEVRHDTEYVRSFERKLLARRLVQALDEVVSGQMADVVSSPTRLVKS